MFNLVSYPDQEPGYEAMSTLSTSALYQHNKVSHAQVDDHTHSLTMSHTHQHKINIQWNLNKVSHIYLSSQVTNTCSPQIRGQ